MSQDRLFAKNTNETKDNERIQNIITSLENVIDNHKSEIAELNDQKSIRLFCCVNSKIINEKIQTHKNLITLYQQRQLALKKILALDTISLAEKEDLLNCFHEPTIENYHNVLYLTAQ